MSFYIRELRSINQHTYVLLTIRSLWDNLPLVLFSGSMFSVLSIPAFLLFLQGLFVPALITGALTIAPGWAALLAQEAEMKPGIQTSIKVMFKAFLHYWVRSAKLGLLAAFPLFAALFTLPILTQVQPQAPFVVWIGLYADVLGFLIIIALSLYSFPLMVMYDLNVRSAQRIAFILTSRNIINTLGLISLGILFVGGILYVSSGLLFILPGVWGLFIVSNCKMTMDEALIQEEITKL